MLVNTVVKAGVSTEDPTVAHRIRGQLRDLLAAARSRLLTTSQRPDGRER
jgi:hypothetical protein